MTTFAREILFEVIDEIQPLLACTTRSSPATRTA
jgi:hypothetical protein